MVTHWHWDNYMISEIPIEQPQVIGTDNLCEHAIRYNISITAYLDFVLRVLIYHLGSVSFFTSLQWRHNGRDGFWNHQLYDCLLKCLFTRRSKKTSKLRVNGLCKENSAATGEFPAQRASNTEHVSIWWRHHEQMYLHAAVSIPHSVHEYVCKTIRTEAAFIDHILTDSSARDYIDGSYYSDVIMCAMASQLTSVSIFYSAVCSGADLRKHHISASLAFVRGIHMWPVNSLHKGPATQKMIPFGDVIMAYMRHRLSMLAWRSGLG